MKRSLLLALFVLFSTAYLFSQVSINTDGSAPHPSAGLDVNFVNKGLLLPRLTFEQINGIQAPAEGLIIFCTNCNPDGSGALAIFQNGDWRVFNPSCTAPYTPSAGTHVSAADQITWIWNPVTIALGYKFNTTNDYGSAQDLGLATSFNEANLDCWKGYTRYLWAYNSCGQSPPLILTDSTLMTPFSPAPTPAFQLPTANSIAWSWFSVSGALGYRWNTVNDPYTAIVLDSSDNIVYLEEGLDCLTSYTRYVWSFDECGVSTAVMLTGTTTSAPPATPAVATHIPEVTQITWKWRQVDGADGYKWHTSNNFSMATDLLTDTSMVESGLVCNNAYTRYVWAYSECGVSTPRTLTQSTLLDPPAAPAASIHQATPVQIEWSWNQVPDADGYKWNTVDSYGTAIEMLTDTAYLETGLTCNLSYTRYVWAYNECGVSNSGVLTKSTELDPPAAPVAATHDPDVTFITWRWRQVADADGYRWNNTNDYGSAQPMGTDTLWMESGLNCNDSYTAYVWAFNECGVSDATVLSQSTDQDPPAAPQASAHVPAPEQIEWKWQVVTDADGYKWNSVNDYGTAEDLLTATSKIQTGLICNTPYNSYVWAYSECGVSSAAVLNQSTALDPPASPAEGTHFSELYGITWEWEEVPDADGYKWGTTNVYSNAVEMGTVTSFEETGLSCNSPYIRYVWAYNECGVSTVRSLNEATSANPPDAPQAAAHDVGPYQIEWKWNNVDGALSYKWNTTNNFNDAYEMGTDTAWLEINLACNSSYTRYVWAVGDCGVSQSTAMMQSTDLDPPAAPAVGTHSATPVQITWDWDPVSGATGYKWNTTNDYGSAQDLGTTTSRTQTGLTCNTSYSSYVWAYSNCGVSAHTVLNQATALDPPAIPTAGTHVAQAYQIEWRWNTVAGADGYKWNDTNNYNTADEMGTSLMFLETSLNCDSAYSRYIWAYSDCGVSGVRTISHATLQDPPDAPTAGTHTPQLNDITWQWNTVTDADGYLWNTTNNLGTASDLGNVTSWQENTLPCNQAQTSYVWAYNDCGTSTATALNATTLADPPDAPLAGSHTQTSSQIVWNWGVVTDATGYKWNTTDNYSTATDMGTNTSRTENGLVCNTQYTRFVWAYGDCGVSGTASLTHTTSNDPPGAPVAGTHVAGATQITWNWNTVTGATDYRWSTTDDFGSATSTSGANTITQTNLSCNTQYTSYVWAVNACGNSVSTTLSQTTAGSPGAPVAGTHVPSYDQITWDWNPVSGASGYKWSAVNNFTTATDVGTNTSYLETGLSCGNNYTRYAWAYNACGESTALTMNVSTLGCWTCGNNLVINHVAGNVAPVNKNTTYGTVTNVPGETSKCWITKNLGATNQPSSATDNTEAASGWYWQFNHMQGFKYEGSTRTPNTTWITEISEYSDWVAANDPCNLELGTGWRIPTVAEWDNVDAAANWVNYLGPYTSPLKMHTAGRIDSYYGIIMERGSKGYYWTSTQTGNVTLAQCMYFNSSNANTTSNYVKAFGFSVRCVKD